MLLKNRKNAVSKAFLSASLLSVQIRFNFEFHTCRGNNVLIKSPECLENKGFYCNVFAAHKLTLFPDCS